jgi:hypothetical protein
MDWVTGLAALKEYQTLLAAIVACASGIWALHAHLRRREHDPRIQFRVYVKLVGHHDRHWVAELLAIVENRGQVPHRMSGLTIDLKGLPAAADYAAPATRTDKAGRQLAPAPFAGQLPFTLKLVPTEGEAISLLPVTSDNRVLVYPGTSMRYMYVTSVPDDLRFLLIHGTLTRPRAEPLRADRVIEVPARP